MFALDTTMTVEPYASAMVQEYQKTLQLAVVDKVKFKNQAVESSKLLAGYYNNIKRNKDSAIAYLLKGQEFDPENPQIKELLDYLRKTPGKSKTGGAQSAGIMRKNSAATKSSAVKNKSVPVPKV